MISSVVNDQIQLLDGSLTGTTIPGQSGLGSNGNEGVHSLKLQDQSFAIKLFCIISRMLIVVVVDEGSYACVEMHLAYFTASVDWAINHTTFLVIFTFVKNIRKLGKK